MPSSHTPPQPHRDRFEGAEGAAYERVVRRQKGYDYETFGQLFPEAHREAARAAVMTPAGDEADPDDRVQPYMGAMLNSPLLMDHISELGVVYRRAGERGDSYAHKDREWVDMVLSEELACWGVYYLHLQDAVSVGVRPEAIKALREGKDEDLTQEELVKARHVRQVARGTVTSASYQAVESLLGRRGAVEFTAFVGHLIMTFRLIQAFGAMPDISPGMVDELLEGVLDGSVELPDEKARVPQPEAS